jgi:hypothetical protein
MKRVSSFDEAILAVDTLQPEDIISSSTILSIQSSFYIIPEENLQLYFYGDSDWKVSSPGGFIYLTDCPIGSAYSSFSETLGFNDSTRFFNWRYRIKAFGLTGVPENPKNFGNQPYRDQFHLFQTWLKDILYFYKGMDILKERAFKTSVEKVKQEFRLSGEPDWAKYTYNLGKGTLNHITALSSSYVSTVTTHHAPIKSVHLFKKRKAK